jgi:hypothetical protein
MRLCECLGVGVDTPSLAVTLMCFITCGDEVERMFGAPCELGGSFWVEVESSHWRHATCFRGLGKSCRFTASGYKLRLH